MRRVAAFTPGIAVPSARFRIRQHILLLRNEGIDITEFYTKFGSYPPEKFIKRICWGIGAAGALLPAVAKSYNYDLTLLQREMISTLVTFEPFVKAPRILDVDDAIFLHPRGKHCARRIAEISERIICGNTYLAESFSIWNRNITIIPTAVDTDYFFPSQSKKMNDNVNIGWIGTSTNLKYLKQIEPALEKLFDIFRLIRLIVVCDRPPAFDTIPPHRVEYIPWSSSHEAESIQKMDIGIMPLHDSPWERGKCSFKMLQYMACSLPVVVSPVGMNKEILEIDTIGFGASTISEWVDSLSSLVENSSLRERLGSRGRKTVEKFYSTHAIAPQIAACINSI